MNKMQALITLKRIAHDPSIADQFTEEEIEKLEEIVARK
jgi:CO dehydrogenase/acetyl-CoA synthase delta subunit